MGACCEVNRNASHLYSMRQMGGWLWSKLWVRASALKVKSLPWCFHSPPLPPGRALTTGAAHWMTQKLVHPGRKLPAFPKDVSPKSTTAAVCLCARGFFSEKQRKEGNCVNRVDSLKCTAQHQRAEFHTCSSLF